jgi:cell pole-organizing protein PopZ
MAEGKGQPEQSMEEILASIRRMIAEGDETGAAAPDAAQPPGARDEDILELTEMVAEDGSVVSVRPMARPAEPPPAAASAESVFRLAPERPDTAVERVEPLVSAVSAAATVAALQRLAGLDARERGSDPPPAAPGRALEDVVRDMVRPMLASWLDQNLPQLVERLVRDEIARLARDAERR